MTSSQRVHIFLLFFFFFSFRSYTVEKSTSVCIRWTSRTKIQIASRLSPTRYFLVTRITAPFCRIPGSRKCCRNSNRNYCFFFSSLILQVRFGVSHFVQKGHTINRSWCQPNEATITKEIFLASSTHRKYKSIDASPKLDDFILTGK